MELLECLWGKSVLSTTFSNGGRASIYFLLTGILDINEEKILSAAQLIVALGLKDVGYEYVNIDVRTISGLIWRTIFLKFIQLTGLLGKHDAQYHHR